MYKSKEEAARDRKSYYKQIETKWELYVIKSIPKPWDKQFKFTIVLTVRSNIQYFIHFIRCMLMQIHIQQITEQQLYLDIETGSRWFDEVETAVCHDVG